MEHKRLVINGEVVKRFMKSKKLSFAKMQELTGLNVASLHDACTTGAGGMTVAAHLSKHIKESFLVRETWELLPGTENAVLIESIPMILREQKGGK